MSTYYIATAAGGGNDANPGTLAEPWATFTWTDSQIAAGDTVYVRGGTYTRNWPTEDFRLAADGASGNRITWQNYAAESPIIQWLAAPPTSSTTPYTPLVLITGDYVTFRGFEVRNSKGRGIEMYEAVHPHIYDCVVHHCWNIGIIADGQYGADSYAIIDGCEIYQASLYRHHGAATWAAGVTVVNGDEFVVKNCKIYNNWGEGLSVIRGGHATFEDNEIYDNERQELYLDNATYVLVQRNLIYHTNDTFDAFAGIAFGNETYGSGMRTTRYCDIINNIVVNTARGISISVIGAAGDGFIDHVIAGNTFVGTNTLQDQTVILIPAANHSNTIIKDNIVIEESGVLANVPADAGLDFDYNCWYDGGANTPEADAQGANDVNDNPDLVDHSHALVAGAVDAGWYKLTGVSPCIGAGLAVAEVTEDYWETSRGDPPDIGAHEYEGATTTTTTLSTTSTVTVSTTSTVSLTSSSTTTLSPMAGLVVSCAMATRTIEPLTAAKVAERETLAAELIARGF